MQPVDALELLDRPLVVVDPEVDEDVRQPGVPAVFLDDQQRGRLLAAPVAARSLRRRETLDQPLRERELRVSLERRRQRAHGFLADEDVALRRVPGPCAVPGPVVAARARPARRGSLSIDDSELALVASLVLGRQTFHDLARAEAFAEESEPVRAVARVRVRLRCDRAHLGLGPWHDRADCEELRLDGDAPLLGLEVASRNRVRRNRWSL